MMTETDPLAAAVQQVTTAHTAAATGGRDRERDYAARKARRLAEAQGIDPQMAVSAALRIYDTDGGKGKDAADRAIVELGGSPAAPRGRPREAVSQPAAPLAAATAVEPIAPARVADLLRAVSQPLCQRLGVEPLTEQELTDGGKAWAPVLDHYMPGMIGRAGPWALAAIWTVQVAGSRAASAMERGAVAPDAGFRPTAEPQDEEPTPARRKKGAAFAGPVVGET